jgi:pheromone a factor receptor
MTPAATSIVLSIVSFVCALLVLIALPWHLRALNVATVSLILWLFIMNCVNGINVLLWSDNIRDIPVWCDISE